MVDALAQDAEVSSEQVPGAPTTSRETDASEITVLVVDDTPEALGLVAAGAAWVMHLLPTSRWVAGTVQLLLFHAGLSLRAHPDSRAAVLWAGLPLAAALAALGIA